MGLHVLLGQFLNLIINQSFQCFVSESRTVCSDFAAFLLLVFIVALSMGFVPFGF